MGGDSIDYAIHVSNHSYGPKQGWQLEGGDWWWYGRTNYPYEDLQFGFYGQRAEQTDETVYTTKYLLPVFAAGNDANDGGAPPVGSGLEPHYHYSDQAAGRTFTDYHYPDGVTSGGYDLINTYATAKNVLTVGAINGLTNGWTSAADVTLAAVSSFGGTDDGRIKPDLVADGYQVFSSAKFNNTETNRYNTSTGTSSAAAAISGGIGLLQQRVREYYGDEKRFLASTYKALLILTANEAGPAPGPDYKFGWGVADIDRAASLLARDLTNYHDGYGAPSARLHPNIIEGVLTNGTTNVVYINYSGSDPLRVVLVWNDRGYYPTNQPVLNDPTSRLINDLDVRVTTSGGGPVALPYVLNPSSRGAAAATGDNTLDNVEMIVTNLTSGSYEIHVQHKGTLRTGNYLPSVTNQEYSLLIEGQEVYLRPELLDVARVSSNHMAMTWSAKVGKSYKLQYATNMPPNLWTDAISSVTATNTTMSVTNVPYSSGENRFYRVVLD